MSVLHVLRVFTDIAGHHGNALGIFLAGGEIPERRRQSIAVELGFSETVFVDDAALDRIRLYTPAAELAFAGHPLVGTAWLLTRERIAVQLLRPPAGEVQVWTEGELQWVRGRPEWCSPWQHVRLDSATEVQRARQAPPEFDAVQLWAFEDGETDLVRARVFAQRFGVSEDEACGSASMLLAAALGHDIQVCHGAGSEIHVRPRQDGAVDLGGRVALVEVRNQPSR